MIQSPPCSACGAKKWQALGSRTFRRDPQPEDEFLALRYRVLFEVWAPGEQELKVTLQLCQSCGFVGYSPRATADEVEEKYRFIAFHVGERPEKKGASALDERRAQSLREYVGPLNSGRTIVDFGGGNGALLGSYAKEGYECAVVDYTPESVPGVVRLGSTLDDLQAGRVFDLIVASHVFEHLADPVSVARALLERLSPQGRLFVEVPLEISGGLPRLREPVTHVNFFCKSSLGVTLARAGFCVERLDVQEVLTESGTRRLAVRALARRQNEATAAEPILPGASEARRLLGLSPLVRLGRAFKKATRPFLSP